VILKNLYSKEGYLSITLHLTVGLFSTLNLQLTIFYLLGCALIQINLRQIKYLNNIVEQDHRGIKRITKPMIEFKTFHSAEATLAGIELYRMLKKGQHVDAKKIKLLLSNFMRWRHSYA